MFFIFMKTFILTILMAANLHFSLAAQAGDSPEMLKWAMTEARTIDSVLDHAIRGGDRANLLLRMLDIYFSFDLIVHAGLYCDGARIAAEAGRSQTDLVNYFREKDMNTILFRATNARKSASRLMEASAACLRAIEGQTNQSRPEALKPVDIIRADALIVELDLTDGLASRNIHVLSQKVEHAVRLLHDIERIAVSLSNCKPVENASISAAEACSRALQSANWLDLTTNLEEALRQTALIKSADCR